MELKGLVLIRNLHRGERTIWLVSKNWLLSVSKDLVLSVVKRASFDEPVQKVKVLYLFSKYSFVGLLCLDLFGKGSQSGEWDVNIYVCTFEVNLKSKNCSKLHFVVNLFGKKKEF